LRKILAASLLFNIIGLGLCGIVIHKLGGISNFIFKLKAKHTTAKINHRISQFASNPNSMGATIFLGDSITEYGEWSELFPNHRVLNRGIAGDGIVGVKNRLDELARHQPDKIFLMIGINDLCYHPSEVVIEAYLDLLYALQDKFKNTDLIVQSILPINNGIYHISTTNLEVDKVNQAIQDFCKGQKIPYIDISSALKDKENNLGTNFTADGIHINGIAYNVWKEQIKHWFPIK